MTDVGKIIISTGVILIVIGILMQLTPLFHLPGDLIIKRGYVTFCFPIATSILLSIILSVILMLFSRK